MISNDILILGVMNDPVKAHVLHMTYADPVKMHFFLREARKRLEAQGDDNRSVILMAEEYLEIREVQLKVLAKSIALAHFDIAGVMGDDAERWAKILDVRVIEGKPKGTMDLEKVAIYKEQVTHAKREYARKKAHQATKTVMAVSNPTPPVVNTPHLDEVRAVVERCLDRVQDAEQTTHEHLKTINVTPFPSTEERVRREQERRQNEALEQARLERERAEQALREAQRMEALRLEEARLEAERLEAERREQARLEAERLEAERREQARLEAERIEAERLEAERLEAERLEAERLEAERLEAERREQARLEAERLEAERLEAERREQARLEAERLEAERREQARLEAERLEAERREQARLEAERLEAERLEAERLEAERREQARLEAERLEAERREQARLEAERLEAERLEAERREQARLEAERLEAEHREAERLEAERIAWMEQERLERERMEEARAEAEERERLAEALALVEREEHERAEQTLAEQRKLFEASQPPEPVNIQTAAEKTLPEAVRVVVVESVKPQRYQGRVRSGQLITHVGDVIVEGSVHAGGEVVASGDIHVYGTGGGRLIAGVTGDTQACIYVQHFDAELISIAGKYHIFEQVEPHWVGKSIKISLRNGALTFEAMDIPRIHQVA